MLGDTDRQEPDNIRTRITVIHLRVSVLCRDIDFTAVCRVYMSNALRTSQEVSSHDVELSEYLDMTDATSRSLIKSLISNPSIDPEEYGQLILLIISLDRKASQNLHTNTIVDVIGELLKYRAESGQLKRRARK